MKKAHRITALIIAIFMMLSLTACGKKSADDIIKEAQKNCASATGFTISYSFDCLGAIGEDGVSLTARYNWMQGADGDLYQDISARADTICHQQTSARGTTWHTVRLAEGSRLERLLGKRIAVNSYHHQAVRRVADGMMTTAVAADGITEAIEGQEGRLVGVQWHPELLPDMRPLWTSFVEAATETK